MIQLAPPAQVEAPPKSPLKARYDWGYLGDDGEGRGTLDLLLEADSGRVVLELHGLGERLVLLQGDTSQGYHLQIPRRKVDLQESSFQKLDLPVLPQLASVAALVGVLREGVGPGVKVTKRDGLGPLKLSYEGKDPEGRSVKVWLTRKRWDAPPPPKP